LLDGLRCRGGMLNNANVKMFENIKINKIIKAKWNYKKEDASLFEKLLHQMQTNGQIENIIVREIKGVKYEVINGNHRLDVMKLLKYSDCHVYNCGDISLNQAKRIAIETNETYFDSDYRKKSEIIATLTKEFEVNDLIKTMNYSNEEILAMQTLANKDECVSDDSKKGDDFIFQIKTKVSRETFERWKLLKSRMKECLGYENDAKVIEFAIEEALNTPIESYN